LYVRQTENDGSTDGAKPVNVLLFVDIYEHLLRSPPGLGLYRQTELEDYALTIIPASRGGGKYPQSTFASASSKR